MQKARESIRKDTKEILEAIEKIKKKCVLKKEKGDVFGRKKTYIGQSMWM